MSRRALLLLALGLAACRIEPVPEQPAGGATVETDVPPPVEARARPAPPGDTARGSGAEAGRAPSQPMPDPAVVSRAGAFAVPVAGVRPGDLVDTFQAARSEGRTHNALDIPAPRGTPVVAMADGEVLRLFESDRGGLTVYQLAADGRTVLYYAHLDAYAPGLAAGQRVRRGDALGTVGDSGNAAPGDTHLHLGVWRVEDPAAFWDGEPVNPYGLLVGP